MASRTASRQRLLRQRKSTLIHEACKQLSQVKAHDKDQQLCLRQRLLYLDGVCEYCRENRASTEDHFFALVVNSRPTQFCDDVWNRIPACKACNSSKGNMPCLEWIASSRKGNPFRTKSKAEVKHAHARFAAYERACLQHCAKKTVDAGWWDDVERRITVFLCELETDINGYMQRSLKESA